jgi:ribosomal protein L35
MRALLGAFPAGARLAGLQPARLGAARAPASLFALAPAAGLPAGTRSLSLLARAGLLPRPPPSLFATALAAAAMPRPSAWAAPLAQQRRGFRVKTKCGLKKRFHARASGAILCKPSGRSHGMFKKSSSRNKSKGAGMVIGTVRLNGNLWQRGRNLGIAAHRRLPRPASSGHTARPRLHGGIGTWREPKVAAPAAAAAGDDARANPSASAFLSSDNAWSLAVGAFVPKPVPQPYRFFPKGAGKTSPAW